MCADSNIKTRTASGFSRDKVDVDLIVGNPIYPCFNYEYAELSEQFFPPKFISHDQV